LEQAKAFYSYNPDEHASLTKTQVIPKKHWIVDGQNCTMTNVSCETKPDSKFRFTSSP
jgi:hypothetical protein